jgi:mannose-6-phosphate isomerase-like protein (cupin superfamily)
VDVIDGERFHREGRPFYQAPVGDEGLWYVLDGTLIVTIVAPGGTEATAELRPGDLCATRLGQAHTGVAGAAGVRILVIDVAV